MKPKKILIYIALTVFAIAMGLIITAKLKGTPVFPLGSIQSKEDKSPLTERAFINGFRYYEGQITISGVFNTDTPSAYLPRSTCFFADNVSIQLIPASAQRRSYPWPTFCFDNQEQARSLLHSDSSIESHCSSYHGQATVTISNYRESVGSEHPDNLAKLESVVSILSEPECNNPY